MMIMYAFWQQTKRPEIKVIFVIEFIDWLDFVLCYNYRWFYLLGYSVEYNDVTFVMIAFLIIQTAWKQHRELS